MEIKKYSDFSSDVILNEERTIPLPPLENIKEDDDISKTISNYDTNGGLTEDEFDDLIDFVKDLDYRNSLNELTDEEKVLSEVLYNILTKKEHGFDYDLYYHRRLGFIKANKK